MREPATTEKLKDAEGTPAAGNGLRPPWRHFLQFCEELQHGEIEKLKIQDGLPILAEVTKKKVKFTA